MVIGGAEIYAQAMPLADRLEITRIHAQPEGDTALPADRSGGVARGVAGSRIRPGQGDDAAFDFVSYVKAGGDAQSLTPSPRR